MSSVTRDKKYQLVCPRCHHEFTYDNGYYDSNIARLGAEINEINLKLQQHRALPWPEQQRRSEWYFRTKRILTRKQKELGELRAIRKCADQQVNAMEYQLFKTLLKERYGEEAFYALLKDVDKELEAYRVSGLMRHEYTRSNALSDVTSVSKL